MSKLDYNLTGLLILCAITSIYTYHQSDALDEVNIQYVQEVLKESPYIGADGGEFNYEFFVLKVKGRSNKFYLQNCSYMGSDKEKILSLIKGDSVSIGIVGDIDLKEDVNVNVYVLSSIRLGRLLEISDYNNCSNSMWKVTYRVGIAIAFILALSLFGKLWWKIRS